MYDKLYEAWRREREDPAIQPLPRDFYIRIAEYIKKIRNESRMLDGKTIKAKLLKAEAENTKKLIKELTGIRFEKLLKTVSLGEAFPKNYLTIEEENVSRDFLSISEFYQNLVTNILRGQVPHRGVEVKETVKHEKVIVRFLRDIPEIVGTDLKIYGPFKSEDVASLPIENAKALIKQGVAAKIEFQ